MDETRGHLMCLANEKRSCTCPLVAENARFMNEIGKMPMVRNSFNRLGYDGYNMLGLVMALLKNPRGGYYTTAFDRVYEFGPEERKLRDGIRRMRVKFLLDHNPLICEEIQFKIKENNYDPDWYIGWLRGEYFKGQENQE